MATVTPALAESTEVEADSRSKEWHLGCCQAGGTSGRHRMLCGLVFDALPADGDHETTCVVCADLDVVETACPDGLDGCPLVPPTRST